MDEAQFLDEGILQVANAPADHGVRVILCGTDMDSRSRPFGPMPALLAVAERVDKLHAVCVVCGELATRNQGLLGGEPTPVEGPTILVGGTGLHEARGRRCRVLPPPDRGQAKLELE